MLVSLYDSAYLVEHETIMTNMIGYSNIHAYMQGKYIQSMLTETKTEEKVIGHIASFAMSQATKQATKEIARIGLCDTLEVAADGVPVCGIVHFLAWCWNNLWDLNQNTPSSQSGYLQTYFEHNGLGGNINTVFVQLYDPYNYPAVTLYEWDSCEGESSSIGVRNFTYNSETNTVTEKEHSSWPVDYPAKDANSFIIPYNTRAEFYEGNNYKFEV